MAEKLSFPILPEKYYANKDLTKYQEYVGTGKYKVKSISDDEWVLEYNDNYYMERTGNITTINVKILNKNIQGFEALKSGDIDFVDTDVEVGAYGRSAFYSKRYNTGVFEGIIFNLNSKKVSDQNVRQAILLAINRDNMIENYLGGYGISTSIPVNPSSYLFDANLPTYSFNPEKAQDILDNATIEANNLRMSAMQYMDDMLLNLENILAASTQSATAHYEGLISSMKQYLDIVQSNRAELHPTEEDDLVEVDLSDTPQVNDEGVELI